MKMPTKRAVIAFGLFPFVWLSALAYLVGDQIYVWPFLLVACLIAWPFNRYAAAAIAVAVGGAQIIEQTVNHPLTIQTVILCAVAFLSLLKVDKVAAAALAVVSAIYGMAAFGLEWRYSMIIAEHFYVLGLCCGILFGPTGGMLEGSRDMGSRASPIGRGPFRFG